MTHNGTSPPKLTRLWISFLVWRQNEHFLANRFKLYDILRIRAFWVVYLYQDFMFTCFYRFWYIVYDIGKAATLEKLMKDKQLQAHFPYDIEFTGHIHMADTFCWAPVKNVSNYKKKIMPYALQLMYTSKSYYPFLFTYFFCKFSLMKLHDLFLTKKMVNNKF